MVKTEMEPKTKTELPVIANLLKQLKSALIFCHVNPDGDTLSCAFALKYALNKLGIKADVVSPHGVPVKFEKLGVFGDAFVLADGEYDGYISVDCSTEGQMGQPYNFFAKQKNTFNIDHHISNTLYAKYNYVCDKAACTMNILDLIKLMGVEIDETLAKTLMIGLITDTGNFSHSNTDTEALEAAAFFCSKGANVADINLLLFNSQPKNRALMYVEVMRGMKFFHNDRLAIINITQEQLKRYGLDKSDTEGFIDFPMTIGTVEVALSVFETKKESFKVSFRSKGVNVCEVAATFGGGGHVRASGAQLNGIFEDVVDKLVFTVGNYLE